jgi:hypothetical protein
MDTFTNAIAVVSAICFGIFAVTLFIVAVRYLGSLLRGTAGKTLVGQDFISKDRLVTVKASGETIDRVKFIGFTNSSFDAKNSVPHTFVRMAVFENSDRERIFVPAATIRYIRELAESAP